VVEQMERNGNPAKLRLVVLDACRNNPRAGRTRGGVRGLSRMSPGDDYTLIAFSTNDQDVAQDGSGANSPYAEALNRHLARAKELPLRRIFELTATDVRAATAQKQRPRTYGDLDSRVGLDGLVLASVVPEPMPQPAAGTTQAQVEQQAWEAAQRANTLAAYDAYLAEFPRGRFAAAARVARASVLPQPAAAPVVATGRNPGEVFKDCADCPEMVVVGAGSFSMGSPKGEPDSGRNEGPQRTVTIARPFALGRYEVTVDEFKRFVAAGSYVTEAERNVVVTGCVAWSDSDGKSEWRGGHSWRSPGFDQTDRHPVVCVSWNDAQAYVQWLGRQTGQTYRLPSEAEWEYAARAGSSTSRPWGDGPKDACRHANGADQSRSPSGRTWSVKHECNDGFFFTASVGSYAPNRFGVNDMMGNASEWVQDVLHENYSGAPSDGSVWSVGGDPKWRMVRGGSWLDYPRDLRSASRYGYGPYDRRDSLGFRIARTL